MCGGLIVVTSESAATALFLFRHARGLREDGLEVRHMSLHDEIVVMREDGATGAGELEALRREVALTRPIIAKMAEQARLSGQVVDPPDSLRRALGLEIPEAPEWDGGAQDYSRNADFAGMSAYADMGGKWRVGASMCCEGLDASGTEQWLEHGSNLKRAQIASLKAVVRIGIAMVARARVGLKALEGAEVEHG
jgi:hypothetical protein